MHNPSRAEKFWLLVFLAVWCFFGLTGRDAMKPEEALTLAPILDWLRHGGLAAASFSPLHTLVSGLFARLSHPWLNIQDGARLADGAFTLTALIYTALAAKRLFGPGYGAAAALALMGCFGLMLRAHAMLPETALLMGYAVLLYAVALARERTVGGAVAIALAGLILSLSRGLPDLLATVLIVLLPFLSPDWRERGYRRAVLFGLLGLCGLLALWIAALTLSGGHELAAWWGQFTARLAPKRELSSLLSRLSWSAWPVWPLALWTLWHEHRRLGRESALHPVLAATVVTFLLGLWPSYPGGGALPFMVPLALLAAHGVANLKRGGAQGFYWFGVLCFMFFGVAFWVYYAALQWGWPQPIAHHLAEMTPLYRGGHPSPGTLLTAGAVTLLWLIAIPLFPRAKVRPVLVWATGMAMTWFLLVILFRPWAAAGWGYRPVIEAMASRLPTGACLRAEVDPAMTAMLRLHLGARYHERGDCAYWLFASAHPEKRPEMRQVWDGFRPRQSDRHYRLYVRTGQPK